MWTPKRVLILALGLLTFLLGYSVYAYFLGGIDGLPPLPEVFFPGPISDPQPNQDQESERKLKMAFGPDCEELNRPIILDLRLRKMIMAADQFDIMQDGRVVFSGVSAALFPKGRSDAKYPEINTIVCEFAYLTLDKPVVSWTELANRKIKGVELRGSRGVTLTNNRRTAEKNDDIEVHIASAPVFYREDKNLIWSDGYVQLLDLQSQPKPTTVRAQGLEVHLSPETAPNRQKPAKNASKGKNEGVSGVELIVLQSNVDMHLWVDSRSGFLAGGQEFKSNSGASSAKPSDKPQPAEKSQVVIVTNGPFHYDLIRDLAWFDSPPVSKPDDTPGSPAQVQVSRKHQHGKTDQLDCNHLELQFRRRATADPDVPRDAATGDREIETALATARPGEDVVLTMDTENLVTYSTELRYLCAGPGKGAQTILKGNPLNAVKEANKFKALELHLVGPDKNGNGQEAFAYGPGQIDIFDKVKAAELDAKARLQPPSGDLDLFDKTTAVYTQHAVWKDTLVSKKVRDGDKVFDLLTLSGDAWFIDDERKQHLHAERIQVWTEPVKPAESEKVQGNEIAASGTSRTRPHRIEAVGDVSARSEDFIIPHCRHMIISFKYEPIPEGKLPEFAQPVIGQPKIAQPEIGLPTLSRPVVDVSPGAKKDPTEFMPKNASSGQQAAKLDAPKLNAPKQGAPIQEAAKQEAANQEAPNPRKPIVLTANDVDVNAIVQGNKNMLRDLFARDDVHVRQEPENPKDKGIDIVGDALKLVRHLNGDKLTVYGNARQEAQLQLGELILIGPNVTIDQDKNTAAVDGPGAMDMPSNASFEGGKPVKPGTRLKIHWTKDMFFNGRSAEFDCAVTGGGGGVQAYQDTGKMLAESLQVTLDRFVSFKEGQKGGQAAKVEKLLCSKKVYVEDDQRDERKKIKQFDRIVCGQLDMDNEVGRSNAVGPGRFYHIAPGTDDAPIFGGGAKPDPKAMQPPNKAPAKGPVRKLTRIDFENRMSTYTKDPTSRTATFDGNVNVYHLPSDDPDVPINPNKAPKDGFYLRCERLHIFTRPVDGKNCQMMEGRKNVTFRTEQAYGTADLVKYDESQDLVIFEGTPGNPTILYKLRGPGAPPQQFIGGKILYNRKTGEIKAEGVTNITSWVWPDSIELAQNRGTLTGSFAFARHDANRQDEALPILGLVARNDR
ncbi:MAG: hypothetical protein HY040_20255 [Planctomycetes bacterium]|nr:hypothetical protein [Planctomycetota bacterium]